MATRKARTRLPADEARRRILDAAERQLAAVGPEGLRLTELAGALGISHPAILHHFGSREGLVRAVLERAYGALREGILERLARAGDEQADARDLLADAWTALDEAGHARLFAWLLLSGRDLPALFAEEPLAAVTDAVESRRARRGRRTRVESQHMVHLVGLALLGDSLFGDRLRVMQGVASDTQEREAFRVWLADLVTERLLR